MCEDGNSVVPAPPAPARSEVARRGDLVLTAADGNRLQAHFAHPASPTGSGVAILPARLGLLDFYRDFAARLAELGLDAVAIDFYGRTAGQGRRGDDFEFADHYDAMRENVEGTDADVAAAVDFLRSEEGGCVERVFTIGFCYGGSMSWRASATNPHVSGCIGLYGAPRYVRDLIPQMKAPLLLLVAGNDAFIEQADVDRFVEELTAAGVSARSKTYPGAPHSFFDRVFEGYVEECRDAWVQMLEFMG